MQSKPQEMLSHVYELRTRCIRILLGLGLAAACTLPFANDLHQFLVSPLLSQLPAGGKMIATSVTSPFMIPLKIALYAAFVLSLPHTLYQLWKFVQPGLYPREKLLGVMAVVASVSLFILGACFAFYLVIPVVFKFIIGSAPAGVAVMTEIGHYLDFLMTMTLAFGLSFQTPMIVVAIAYLGLVDLNTLKQSRGYVMVAAFVIGAIFTPPDIISQCMLAVPLCLLYELGLLVARGLIYHRQRSAIPAEVAQG